MAGINPDSMIEKIEAGELHRTPDGIAVSELIRVFPDLKPLASVKLRKVKSYTHDTSAGFIEPDITLAKQDVCTPAKSSDEYANPQSGTQSGTVELLIRELEWNKELLEQTNQLMAKQLADQRALIADQARRLDEKDRFWARQIEIAQSLLPAPQPVPAPRKKWLGLF